MKPWEFSSALTSDRLIRVADVLRRSRDSAAHHARRALGDTLFSIGLVSYERSCHALSLASADVYRDWLSIGPADNHFLVKICGIPSRFYRGDADLPVPKKTLKMGPDEERATQLAFTATGMSSAVRCLRFEVEKNRKGFTTSVNFVLIDEDGARFDSWPIPRFIQQPTARRTKRGAVQLRRLSLDDPKPDRSADEENA